jgi:hypothetical protein
VPRARFPELGWNRREARGGPGAKRGMRAAGSLLVGLLLALPACFGDSSERPADAPSVSAPTAETAPSATSSPAEAEIAAETSSAAETADGSEPARTRVRAACPLRSVRLFLNRPESVAVLLDDGGRLVASISDSSQAIDGRACPAGLSGGKDYVDREQPQAIFDSATVACVLARPIEVDVYPIVLATGKTAGTALVVSMRNRRVRVASVVTFGQVAGGRIYYAPSLCRRV